MKKVALVAILTVALSASAATVYTNEADFLAAIVGGGGYLLEDFDNYTYGSFTGDFLDVGPQNGYSGHITAEGLANSYLWSGDGNMSTNDATDWLRVDFTGPNDTYSIGGFFFPSEINGFYQPGEIVIDLSDGTNYSYNPPNGETFVGFVASEPLTWATIDAIEAGPNAWSTMDHLYIDSPEPASLSLLALGGLALLRRR